GEVVDVHAEAVLAELGEVDQVKALVDPGMLAQDPADPLDQRFDLFGPGAVGDAQRERDPPDGHGGEVFDLAVGDGLVGDEDQGPRPGADARRAEPDGFHEAFHVADLHPVAYFDGLVRKDDDRAEHVGDGVLRGQGHREAADAQAAQEAGDGVAQLLDDQDRADDGDKELERLLEQRDDGRFDGNLVPLGLLLEIPAQLVDEPHRGPDDQDGHGHFEGLVHRGGANDRLPPGRRDQEDVDGQVDSEEADQSREGLGQRGHDAAGHVGAVPLEGGEHQALEQEHGHAPREERGGDEDEDQQVLPERKAQPPHGKGGAQVDADARES